VIWLLVGIGLAAALLFDFPLCVPRAKHSQATLPGGKDRRDRRRIPRPLRWLAALGLAPVPGPFDEVLLIIVAVPFVLFYREPLLEAWQKPWSEKRS
jgi:hypothetical protein